jgi:hypothetical protein
MRQVVSDHFTPDVRAPVPTGLAAYVITFLDTKFHVNTCGESSVVVSIYDFQTRFTLSRALRLYYILLIPSYFHE